MEADEIIELLDKHTNLLYIKKNGQYEPANPVALSSNLLIIRGLLVKLVDNVAEAELDYRKSKAVKFDGFIKEGMKKSPAFELLEMDNNLIDKKIATERLRNFMKYTDGLCTSVQSVLKVQIGSEKSNY